MNDDTKKPTWRPPTRRMFVTMLVPPRPHSRCASNHRRPHAIAPPRWIGHC